MTLYQSNSLKRNLGEFKLKNIILQIINFIIFASAEWNIVFCQYFTCIRNKIYSYLTNFQICFEKYSFFLFILAFIRISFCDAYFETSCIPTWMKHAWTITCLKTSVTRCTYVVFPCPARTFLRGEISSSLKSVTRV